MAATDSGDLGSSCLPVLSQFSSSLIGRKVWDFGDLGLLNFFFFNSYHVFIQVQIKSVSNALFPAGNKYDKSWVSSNKLEKVLE